MSRSTSVTGTSLPEFHSPSPGSMSSVAVAAWNVSDTGSSYSIVATTALVALSVVWREETSCSSYETKMPVCGPVSTIVNGCVPGPKMVSAVAPATYAVSRRVPLIWLSLLSVTVRTGLPAELFPMVTMHASHSKASRLALRSSFDALNEPPGNMPLSSKTR